MLTPEKIKILTAPFPRSAHEFIQGFVYISEDAITNRIEEVDPNWTFEILDKIRLDGETLVHAKMTISEVFRDGIGMQRILERAWESEKGAATDALKRCARLFGIGRYLLSAPKEGATFDNWLNSLNAQKSDHWAANEKERSKVIATLKEFGFSTAEEIAVALNRVDRRISDRPVDMRLSQTKFENADLMVEAIRNEFKKLEAVKANGSTSP